MYLFITILLAAAVTWIFKLVKLSDVKFEDYTIIHGIKLIATFIITLIILGVQPYTVHRVDAGNVGIEVALTGDARGVGHYEYKTGYVVYNTWFTRLYEFPTYQQHVEYPEQIVITKGGLQCEVTPSFNYSLKSGDVGDMFSSLRLPIDQIEKRWLQNAIVGTVNDVANKWAVDSVFNHRQEFESNIIAQVNIKIARWFTVSQMRTNIKPPASLQGAIESKIKALQNVQVAENEKKVAIAQGLTREATAKADSAVAVTKAAGDARAIRERQISLTPLYIHYLWVERWDGKVPTVSSNAGMMLNLADLK